MQVTKSFMTPWMILLTRALIDLEEKMELKIKIKEVKEEARKLTIEERCSDYPAKIPGWSMKDTGLKLVQIRFDWVDLTRGRRDRVPSAPRLSGTRRQKSIAHGHIYNL